MEKFNIPSLKENCLRTIVRNFDSFLPALEKDENINWKYCLQRNFSNALFSIDCGLFWKRHASFLINRYLQTLDLNRFAVEDIDEVIKILKRQGEGILNVTFSEPSIQIYSRKARIMQLVCSLPSSLKSLQLARISCRIEVLQCIAENCPNIQELTLEGFLDVKDEELEAAFSNSGNQFINNMLRKLDFSSDSVTTRGLILFLNNCPNLIEMCHENIEDALIHIYRHDDVDNDSQFRKYNLETLELSNLTSLDVVRMLCPNVRSLTVRDIMTQRYIDICKDFERLEHINFEFDELVSLTPFIESRGYTLREISLRYAIVPIDSLIKFCPRIQSLDLCSVEYEGCERQSFDPTRFSLQILKTLKICYASIHLDGEHISKIFACAPNLQILKLYDVSGLSHDFVSTIVAKGLPYLTDLELDYTDIDERGIEKFSNAAPNLKRILMTSTTRQFNPLNAMRMLQLDNRISLRLLLEDF